LTLEEVEGERGHCGGVWVVWRSGREMLLVI
jgi:hypothetical protein